MNWYASEPVSQLNRQTGKPANRQTEKGFTLIEVMLAVVILAFGLIGVIRAYIISIDALEISQYTVDASYLLNEKFAQVQQEMIKDPDFLLTSKEGEFEDKYEGFKWKMDVSDSANENLKEIKITVSNERMQPEREESLVSYVEIVSSH